MNEVYCPILKKMFNERSKGKKTPSAVTAGMEEK